jgi:2-furoyl-CoA dehydrogenase large subunit
VRPGHDSYWNSHAGFSGTYASQFAVTGLEAVKGATEKLSLEIRRLAGGVLGGVDPDDIVLEGGFAKIKGNPRRRCRSWRAARSSTPNNAVLPPELRDITLNCRYVYVPPFTMPGLRDEVRQPDADLRDTDHACVVEIDPETGHGRARRLRGSRRLRNPASTHRSSRARCTARPSTRSAPRCTRPFAYDEYGSC